MGMSLKYNFVFAVILTVLAACGGQTDSDNSSILNRGIATDPERCRELDSFG
jgi:hypothetical protein